MQSRRNAFGRAFTLIELLVVIAITAILLTVIIVPLVQSFNLTRTAQAFEEAQERARIVTERISREMSNSVGVRDNTTPESAINIDVPSGPGSTATLVTVPLRFAKVDLYNPAQEGQGDGVNGWVDPTTGKVDPTLKAPKGQIALSSAQGLSITRYFVGRRDPFKPYNNPYQVWSNSTIDGGTLKARNADRDNLYVLYRVEVPLYKVDRLQGSATFGKYITNNDFFYDWSRATAAANPRGYTGPMVDDPDFFNPSVNYPAYQTARSDDKNKAQMVQNWLSKAVIVTELSRYDMILPFYDKASLKVVFDKAGNNLVPRLQSLVSFRPTRISEGAAEGKLAIRPGEESDNAITIAPDMYLTQSAGWSNATITMYPVFGGNRAQGPVWNAATDPYEVGVKATNPPAGGPYGFSIYGMPAGFSGDPLTGGTELFDVYAYEAAIGNSSLSPYPFSFGLEQANSRSNWLTNSPATFLPIFAPFEPDGNLGRIIASFGIDQVGDRTKSPPSGETILPRTSTGPEVTPANDLPASPPTYRGSALAAINTGTFSSPDFATINRKFNKIWFDYPSLRPDIHRFMDLRVTPQNDGSAGPLSPVSGFPRARIVPGSEEVFGPDQRPGPNYGQPIRYSRTTNAVVGPNQYRINYVDLPEPDWSNATVVTGLGLNPAEVNAFLALNGAYDPTNFISAVYQPRFKAGYIQFNSDPNVPLPGDDASTGTVDDAIIRVYYKFQFTQAVRRPGQTSGTGVGDTFAVEYDSRQLMSVLISIRNYPQSTVPTTQIVTLKAQAPIRNYLR